VPRFNYDGGLAPPSRWYPPKQVFGSPISESELAQSDPLRRERINQSRLDQNTTITAGSNEPRDAYLVASRSAGRPLLPEPGYALGRQRQRGRRNFFGS
jgi:hypothetical protein